MIVWWMCNVTLNDRKFSGELRELKEWTKTVE